MSQLFHFVQLSCEMKLMISLFSFRSLYTKNNWLKVMYSDNLELLCKIWQFFKNLNKAT